ncbi:MAG: hypothetical protein IPP13_21845 [Kouleothrix sp.]|jgi:hypothetical protein|nr:hypothetical protein [Kouleothrix sp.]
MKPQPPAAPRAPAESNDTAPQPPIQEGRPLSEEQKRLIAFFADAESKQVDFLDEAGKRIIELTTALLGVLFAIVAFGDKFPPPYLSNNPVAKFLSLTALACYIMAMLLALRTVQPRNYQLFRHNLDRMRQELDRLVANKQRSLWWAGALFWIGSAVLALQIAAIILSA